MTYAQMTPDDHDVATLTDHASWTLTVHDTDGTTIDTLAAIALPADRAGALAAAAAVLGGNGWRPVGGDYNWSDKGWEFTAPVVKA